MSTVWPWPDLVQYEGHSLRSSVKIMGQNKLYVLTCWTCTWNKIMGRHEQLLKHGCMTSRSRLSFGSEDNAILHWAYINISPWKNFRVMGVKQYIYWNFNVWGDKQCTPVQRVFIIYIHKCVYKNYTINLFLQII